MKQEEGINISHVNIENMGGRDQSQVKDKSLKSSKKLSPFPKDVPKSHIDDIEKTGMQITKLISSLRLQQTIYSSIYTDKECAWTSAQTMFVHVWPLTRGR